MSRRPSLPWTVRLTDRADQDIVEILRWTSAYFGARQAQVYARTLSLAIEALIEGPEVVGVRTREEIALRIRSLHVARRGRKGRHFVVFRVAGEQMIDVLRLLHDSMDLIRQIEDSQGDGHPYRDPPPSALTPTRAPSASLRMTGRET